MTLTVLTLKYGSAYGPEYVNRLRNAIIRHSSKPLRLLCMTDDRKGIHDAVEILKLPVEPYEPALKSALAKAAIQGRLKKVSLFRRGLVPHHSGPLLILDLDVVVVGDLVPLLHFAPGKVAMRAEWNASSWQLGHGSVERIDPDVHGYLYDDMVKDPEGCVRLGNGSEQNYTSLSAHRHGHYQSFPDEWIVSFKRDCRPMRPFNLILPPALPKGAKVVCFHGKPKMSDAVAGYKAGIFHSTRRAEWLVKAWADQ